MEEQQAQDEYDEIESEDGEDVVLNEIGDKEESKEVSFTYRSGRGTGNKRRMESDCLFY